MRAGVCTVQQALTAEAANLVKQAVGLARRRGHAQVTPLHVASAMLASSTGLLRRACLQSHSHPLQFRALELCFNVALNRLPASTSSPLLGPHSSHHHHHHPSLSNALVAAFKRAQAHQRRGSIENQQQPILALKIELEHLIISILDDPSVSRVMREAGFSSTQVKTKVEQTVSLEVCSQTPSSASKDNPHHKQQVVNLATNMSSHSVLTKPVVGQVRDEDIANVLNNVVNKRRNSVIIGESVGSAESVVRGVMDKLEKSYVQFISLPLFSLRNLPKDEVEQKLVELKCLVKSYIGRGVVLYLGDLKWISEFWASSYGDHHNIQQRRNSSSSSSSYCPVEHLVMELKRLVCGVRESNGKLFLMGIATFQTYIKCKTGHPSLETIWELSPLTISVDSLSLSLNLDSESQLPHQHRNKSWIDGISWPLHEAKTHTSSFNDRILLNFDNSNKEAQSTATSLQNKDISTSTTLPLWLQNCKGEAKTYPSFQDKDSVNVRDVYKKWNVSPLSSSSSPNSPSSQERNPDLPKSNLSFPLIFEPKKSLKEHQFWISDSSTTTPPVEDVDGEGYGLPLTKPDLLSNPNSSPNSASSSEAIEEDIDGLNEFKVLNAENLNILCNALERRVSCSKETISEIVTTILECRSGLRNTQSRDEAKEETWLFFNGADCEAKQKIGRELARLIFGSQTNFVSISLTHFSIPNEESNNKRKRDESSSYLQRFGEALNENPHRVFFMEEFEHVDYCSKKGIKQAIESGRVMLSDGESSVPLKDSIIILSSESSFSTSLSLQSRACSSSMEDNSKEELEQNNNNKYSSISLDLNIAIEDNDDDDTIGILDYVDKQIMFRVQQL